MPIKAFSLSNQIKSFAYQNFVLNGIFNNTNNWTAAASTLSASNNTLNITGNGTSTAVRALNDTNLTPVTGNKIFVMGLMKATNSDATLQSIRINGTTGGTELTAASVTSVINQENLLNGVVTLTNQTGKIQIILRANYSTAAISNGKTLQAKEVFAIDLTALFGAGNEPTAYACTQIFRFFETNSQPNFSKQIAT